MSQADAIDIRHQQKVLLRVKDELLALALEAVMNRSMYTKATYDDGVIPLVTDDVRQVGPRTILVAGSTAVASKNALGLVHANRIAGVIARDTPTQLPIVLAAVEAGCTVTSHVIIERAQTVPVLTDQQLQVLTFLIEGDQNPRIGHRLGLSEASVKRHVSHLLVIFEAETRVDLARRAADLGVEIRI